MTRSNYTDRANTTRLRISAHRLEIELGRYNKTPRDERICSWCNLVLGASTIENEAHLLNHCDLNAATRHRTVNMIKILLNCPVSPSHSVSTITNHTILMKVISIGSHHITSSLTSESAFCASLQDILPCASTHVKLSKTLVARPMNPINRPISPIYSKSL